MELGHKGFEEHGQKKGLWLKKLEDGAMLYADFRKEKASFYATKERNFLESTFVDSLEIVKEIKSLIEAEKSKTLDKF